MPLNRDHAQKYLQTFDFEPLFTPNAMAKKSPSKLKALLTPLPLLISISRSGNLFNYRVA
jgi:hypothetical protein